MSEQRDLTGPAAPHPAASGHGDPRLHLAINLVHLLATAGAVIEAAHEIAGWLHAFLS